MMNSNALCVMILKYLIDNYITIISQCCSNSTLLKKKQNNLTKPMLYHNIRGQVPKEINGWGSTSITACRKPFANIGSRETALIFWFPVSACVHLTPLTGIKIDFQPPASCIIYSTENKSALSEIVLMTMKLVPQRGSLISCVSCPHCISSLSGITEIPEGPRHSEGWAGLGITSWYHWHLDIHSFIPIQTRKVACPTRFWGIELCCKVVDVNLSTGKSLSITENQDFKFYKHCYK